jgi:hypothetical protein
VSRHGRRFVYLALAIGVALLASRDARAHTTGMSQADFTLGPDGIVDARLIFAASELASAYPLDRNKDGEVTREELKTARPDLEKLVEGGIGVTADDQPCEGRLDSVELVEGDGLSIAATFQCPKDPGTVAVTMFLLTELRGGHRQAVRISAGSITEQKVLTGTARYVSLATGKARTASATGKPRGRTTPVVILAAAMLAAFIGLIVVRLIRRKR